MNEKEIIEGNKLIAEFHGWKHTKTPKDKGYGYWDFPAWGKSSFGSGSFQYHTSWDWLMPVIEKIESLGYFVFIGTNACHISDKKNEVIVHCNSFDNKRQTVFEAVESFIKWYNQTK